MSIIEKAVEKLNSSEVDRQAVQPRGESQSVNVADGNSTLNADSVNLDQQSTSQPSPPPNTSQSIDIEISFEELAGKGMVTPDSPRSPIAEEYRAIKRPLLTNIEGKGLVDIRHPNLIMVTDRKSVV